jgi:hypothetical protein
MHIFRRFLLEGETLVAPKSDKHISHVEDAIVHHGHHGVKMSSDFLDDAHDLLTGHKSHNQYDVKYDAKHPFLFGVHPKGQFFVSSKSSQSPKINFSNEDIINNMGHNPKLAAFLVAALAHLPKIMPKESKAGDIYQGDFLHLPETRTKQKGFVHFKPNSLQYSASEDSPQGQAVKNSKLGISLHTKHEDGEGKRLEKKDHKKFIEHPDVHVAPSHMDIDPKNYSPKDIEEFLKHKDLATKFYKSMQPDVFDASMLHVDDILKHIHNLHQSGEKPDFETLINTLHKGHAKDIKTLNTDKNKKAVASEVSGKSSHLRQHSVNIDKVLKLHGYLGDAKNVLCRAMAKNIPFIHSHEDEPASPEGVIAHNSKDKTATKFVNRTEYAKKKNDKKSDK